MKHFILSAVFFLISTNILYAVDSKTLSYENRADILFVKNAGQITDQSGKRRNDIDYKLQTKEMTMFIGSGQLHYQWGYSVNSPNTAPITKRDASIQFYRMDVELVGANKRATAIAEEEQPYYENYYLPQCAKGVIAHSFKRIVYKDVYPNIDWVIYVSTPNPTIESVHIAKDISLKYDFVVHPGGNPADIKMQYKGATSLQLKDGGLIAQTPFGNITESAPYSYYSDTKDEAISAFVLNGNSLSYAIPGHSNSTSLRTLVIDPSLAWATYYGGSLDETGLSICSDTGGNVYLVGQAASASNIATTGAFQTTFGGSQDAFIAKFNNAGARQWATYFGGSDIDLFSGVVADTANGIFVLGKTRSTSGITTSGAFQTSFNGASGYNILLAKFDLNGARQWATYYGDNSSDIGSITCDHADIYFSASSPITNMSTSGAFQTTIGDGLLTRFTSNGSRVWATYYNGTMISVAYDVSGYIYFSGTTTSSTNVATAGTYLTSLGGTPGSFYAPYVAKFTTGGGRIWGTYYNSTGVNSNYFTKIASDGLGNVVTAGVMSTGGMASTGAYQTTFGGGASDGILVKFNSTGGRQWATYYGGSGLDEITGIAPDPKGNIYITGRTQSTNAIATANGYKTTFSGINDLFLAQFADNGQRNYATYYGGADVDNNTGLSGSLPITYSRGRVFITGATKSTSGIATTGAYQTALAGGSDALIVAFDADTSVFINQPFANTLLCQGDSLHIPYIVTQKFRSTNTFTFQLSDASGSFSSPTTIGSITSQTGGIFAWQIPASVTAGTGYRVRILANGPIDTANEVTDIRIKQTAFVTASNNGPLCSGATLNLTAAITATGASFAWTGPASYANATQSPSITNTTIARTGRYYVTSSLSGCSAKDSTDVVVNPSPPTITASNNGPLCAGSTLNLNASNAAGATYNWTGPNSFSSTSQNPSIFSTQLAAAGTYSVTASLPGCTSAPATTTVSIVNGPTATIYPNPKDTICSGKPVTLNSLINNAGTGYTYQWVKNGGNISGATTFKYTDNSVTNGDSYYLMIIPGTGAACSSAVNSNVVPMTVLQYQAPNVSVTATDSNAWPGLFVNFTATSGNAGSFPKYQWQLNGKNVLGATSSIWGATTLNDKDSVCVVLTSSYFCSNPATAVACKMVKVATGIITNNSDKTTVYPNPFNSQIVVSSVPVGSHLQVSDMYGRLMYSGTAVNNTTNIITKSYASGIYILQIVDTNGIKKNYQIVKEE